MWNLKKINSWKQRTNWWLPGMGLEVGKGVGVGKGDQRAQTSILSRIVLGI